MKIKREPTEIELYIHIPFCIKKCNYCDFLSFSTTEKERNRYIDALCEEIRFTGSYVDPEHRIVRSIFLGGGTPSILESSQTGRILQAIRDSFSVKEDAEISMEANPGTLTEEKLRAYYNMGIHRLSIGLQSVENSSLKRLGRIHTYEEFLANYHLARRVGFQNINIDLMSALPGQTLASYQAGLAEVLSLDPEHISSYSLILEEGTPFYEDETIESELPDEDTERQMYELTKTILSEYGYQRYEISNYAKAGKECLHNIGYWDDVPYLGMGLGAASYWKYEVLETDSIENDTTAPHAEAGMKAGRVIRFSNTRSLEEYVRKPFLPFEERQEYQILSIEEQMEEYMFLGLRKMNGISIQSFQEKFHRDIKEVYGQVIAPFVDMNLLELVEGRLRLTEQGISVSNRIFAEFLFDRDC